MLIQVRIRLGQAQTQIRKLQAQLAAVEARSRSAGAAGGSIGSDRNIQSVKRFGNQVQWAGRQLQYNFTLPIALAGAAATKWALENEKAMTRVKKVYGDGEHSAQSLSKEVDALGRAFVALSSKYGIAQADVINIAGDWAAAGASGIALAKSVETTLKTIVLGEMDAASATKALISIQMQYNQSSGEMVNTLNDLNAVENQTATSLQDLITSMQKSAGMARNAGVSHKELAAMTAALVPAAGSAANAGNALKTIFTRLANPVEGTAKALGALGINIDSMAWRSKNGTQKLMEIKDAFEEVSDAQKAQAASMIAGTYQVSRFSILMDALANKNSYYYKALAATSSATKTQAIAQYELNSVLESSPKKFEIIGSTIKNSMSAVIVPLLPLFIQLANSVAKLATNFANMDQGTRQMILLGLLFLAGIGPIMRYIGAVITLITYMGSVFRVMKTAAIAILTLGGVFGKVAGIIRLFTAPWLLLAVAIGGAIFAIVQNVDNGLEDVGNFFRGLWNSVSGSLQPVVDFFRNMVQSVIDAFNALPTGVKNAIVAVVNIIASAAREVYEWFSYLNPFAHHSPSLVEVVTAGMAEIRKQYGSVSRLGQPFKKAATDLAAFKKAAGSQLNADGFADNAQDIKKAFPALLPLFQALRGDLKSLNAALAAQQVLIDAQQVVVDQWRVKLDAANAALEKQQDILDKAEAKLSSLQDAYASAEQIMNDFASAPIEGMQQFTDDIFANEQAQKALQLQILQYEQVNGSIDDVKNNMASLAGEIEKLKGDAAELRNAGAGSDVLGPINAQISQMEAAYSQMGDAVNNSPVSDLQAQLDELEKQGQILELQKDIKFDPLTKQIQDLANAQQELPYDTIIQGIKDQQAEMAKLQPQIDAQTQAVKDQKAAVEAAQVARDSIQASYDSESAKLQTLKDQYDNINSAIQEITDSLNAMGSSAQDAVSKLNAKKAAKDAADAKGSGLGTPGDLPDTAGSGFLGREGSWADQASQIDEFTKEIQDSMGGLGDVFAPIKNGWNKAWGWIKTNLGPVGASLTEGFKTVFSGIGDAIRSFFASSFGQSVVKTVTGAFTQLGRVISTIVIGIVNTIKLFWPDIERVFIAVIGAIQHVWEKIGPTLIETFKKVWPVIKVVAGILGGVFLLALKVVASILSNVLGPAFDLIIGTVQGFLNIIGGVADFIASVFTGKWSQAWNGIKSVFLGVWQVISSIFKGTIGVIWGVIKGFVEGIVGFFEWLYDVLVGHSIIPDLVKAIVTLFKWMIAPIKFVFKIIAGALKIFAKAVAAIWNAIWPVLKKAFEIFWKVIKGAWDVVLKVAKTVFNGIKTAITTIWDALWKAVKAAWELLWDKGIKKAWDGLKKIAETIWGGVKTAIKTAWDGLKTAVMAVWDALWTNGIKKVWDGLKKVSETIWGGVKTAVSTAWDGLKTAVKATWDALWTNGIKKVWDGLKSVATTIWSGVKTAVSTAWDGLKTAVKAVWDALWTNGIKKVWDGLKSVATNIWNGVKNAVVGAWDGLKTAIKAVWDAVWTNGIWKTWSGLKDTVSSLWNGIVGGLKGAWNGIKSFFKSMWDGVGRVFDTALDILINKILNFVVRGIANVVGIFGVNTDSWGVHYKKQYSKEGGVLNFAKGGQVNPSVLPGYTPGRDVHTFYSPSSGIMLHLSGGEGILRPEAVRQLGGSAGIDAINRSARGLHFADGGTFGNVKPSVGGGMTYNNPNPGVKKAELKALAAGTQMAPGSVPPGAPKVLLLPDATDKFTTFRLQGDTSALDMPSLIEKAANAVRGVIADIAGGALRAIATPFNYLFDTIPSETLSSMANGAIYKSIGAIESWIRGQDDSQKNFDIAQSWIQAQLLWYKNVQGKEIGKPWPGSSPGNAPIPRALGGLLPAFANGGIASRPTLGVFGESGKEILAPLTPLWNRLDRIERMSATPVQQTTHNEYHFHGELSFPNVTKGGDAKDFLDNLESLAGR